MLSEIKIIIIIVGIFIFGYTDVFPQDSTTVNGFEVYKNELSLFYNNIIQNKITTQQAKLKLDSLKNSNFSNYKQFYLLVHSELDSLINKLQNGKEDSSEVYVVKEGDNLSKIATRIFKNAYKWNDIYQSNKTAIKNPDIIYPNQKLFIQVPYTNKISKEETQSKIDTSLTKKTQIAINKQPELQNSEDEDSGLEGLIVDETFSKIGHDFYDLFYAGWEKPKNIKDYTITISEKPLPQLGTQITILINDNPVFQRFIQPRYEIIEETAQEGLEIAYSYLENYNQIQKELQGEDMQGTGIF